LRTTVLALQFRQRHRHIPSIRRLPIEADRTPCLVAQQPPSAHKTLQRALKAILVLGTVFAFARSKHQVLQVSRMTTQTKLDSVIKLDHRLEFAVPSANRRGIGRSRPQRDRARDRCRRQAAAVAAITLRDAGIHTGPRDVLYDATAAHAAVAPAPGWPLGVALGGCTKTQACRYASISPITARKPSLDCHHWPVS